MRARIIKLLASIGFLLIILSILQLTPSKGYELSLYTSLPVTVWIFLMSSIICGITIIVLQVLDEQTREVGNFWLVGLLIIILSNAVIFFLPTIRGYVTYGRWDTPMHIGYIIDIISTNHVQNFNIYPITHILIAEISILLRVSPIAVVTNIIPFFLILYVLFTYCLAKVVLHEKNKIVLAVLASTVSLFSYINYQVLPNALSIFILPFILYVYFKVSDKKSYEFNFLLIIIVILCPFLHPLTSLILILGLGLMELFKVTFNVICEGILNKLHIFKLISKMSLNPLLISFIILMMWLSSHHETWGYNLRTIAKWFSEGLTEPTTVKVFLDTFHKLNLNIQSITNLFIKTYGHVMIFSSITLIAALIILNDTFSSHLKDGRNRFILLGWFVLNAILYLWNTFATVRNFGHWRILSSMMTISPVFVGFGLYELFIKNSPSKDSKTSILKPKAFLMISIIIISSIIGMFNTYPSPYTLTANHQITNMEICGLKWHYDNKDREVIDRPLKMDSRFAIMLFGTTGLKDRSDIMEGEPILNHFGYINCTSLGTSLIEDAYIPISKYDKLFHTELYPQLNEFTKADFQKMNYDPTVVKIYSNGEFVVWRVYSYER